MLDPDGGIASTLRKYRRAAPSHPRAESDCCASWELRRRHACHGCGKAGSRGRSTVTRGVAGVAWEDFWRGCRGSVGVVGVCGACLVVVWCGVRVLGGVLEPARSLLAHGTHWQKARALLAGLLPAGPITARPPTLRAKTADLEACTLLFPPFCPILPRLETPNDHALAPDGPTARRNIASPTPDCFGDGDIESGLTDTSSCTMAFFAMGWHKPDNVAGSSAPAIMVGLFVATGGLLFGYDTG